MERVGAGNFIGSAAGNLSLDDTNGAGSKTTGSITSLRGRQESPFDGGPKSFLSSTHLRSVDNTGETKGSDKALLGEVLDLLKQVVSLVEQLFANRAEGSSSGSAKPEEAAAAPTETAAKPEASSTAPSGSNSSEMLGEVLDLLQALIELLEKKFGAGNDAKPSESTSRAEDSTDPSSSSEGDVVSQVLELVSQLIELLQQRLGPGDADQGSAAATQEDTAAQAIADIKDKLDAISQQTGKDNQVSEATSSQSSQTVEPTDDAPKSGSVDSEIMAEIISILSRLVSLLQQVSGVQTEAAE
ncbi:hypothetical protein G6L28_15190 [Agrobacterium larrymoorei]|uniref:hypothetical protein n=1 Tax=Agrobacterium larrymoorei TaxID=160699 RepID=UPI0015743C42|nr:hypothetical protein [Agrobacterium larrymoorei]NTJ43944.1 hypothetical protein [Agrobacterium larrymoorei]